MPEEPLNQKIILQELECKNEAIHEYDKMLWPLRTGFLTLFFAGWGILLKSFIENKCTGELNSILIMMAIISLVICCGGLMIDINYSRRKYRVIYSLENLNKILIFITSENKLDPKTVEEYLLVSGAKDDTKYLQVSGYTKEKNVALIIYLMPLITMVIGIILLWQ